jgi:PAS domain S-box-containing protein
VFDTILTSISDFAYIFDRDGRFIYSNKALLDLLGLKNNEIIGKNFFDLKYPDDLAARLQRQIQQVIDTRQSVTDETPYTSQTGAGGYYEYIFVPVMGADGAVESVAGTTRDITQRRAMEQERDRLLASERQAHADADAANAAKDRFLAVLSHELRTPLSPVVMTVAAMEFDPDLPHKFREDVAMIRRNIELETKLIDDLLDLSRVTSGKLRLNLQPQGVHEILRQALQICDGDLREKRLNVIERLHAKRDRASVDAARLQQVFWNLVRNATKFTPAGGDVTVRTWNDDGGHLCVDVTDSGIGIAPELLPRIFDAFEQGDARITRQFGGLGLGLAIAKAVVEMHGGAIGVASDGAGKGTTFTVRLNVVAARPVTGDVTQPSPAAATSDASPRLLLVDDHPDTARTLARLLTRSGYEVRTANSVAGALKLAAAEPFDLVVSDIGLPDGTGYELMQEARARHGLSGIALSGYGMEEDMRRSKDVGFVEHVVKPVNMTHLEQVIRRAIDAAG